MKKLKQNALSVLLNPSEKALKDTLDEFHILEEELSAFNQLDVSGVEPMWTPIETSESFLREDEPCAFKNTEPLINNADQVEDHQVVINKVVK